MIAPCRAIWKGTLTDRERFNRQMHYESVDRCFNMEFGYWKENFREWDLFVKNGITNNDQAHIFFNFDRIWNTEAETWLHPRFTDSVVEETETKRIVMSRDGLKFCNGRIGQQRQPPDRHAPANGGDPALWAI